MVLDAFRPYREIYDEKKKRTVQTKLTMFMRKETPPRTPTPEKDPDDPQPSTSKE